MNIRTAISLATQSLKKSASPVLDAEVLLSFVLKKPKEFLYGHPDFKLSEIQDSKFRILIRKRANHWPVAYLTGHKEFFGLDLLVTKDVLVPRPETELLVELALERLKIRDLRFKNIVEVGTGSGNIIISLVIQSEARNLRFFATDTSAKALAVARRNARRHGVAKIKFLRGNLLAPVLQATIYNLRPILIVALPRRGEARPTERSFGRGGRLPAGEAGRPGEVAIPLRLRSGSKWHNHFDRTRSGTER